VKRAGIKFALSSSSGAGGRAARTDQRGKNSIRKSLYSGEAHLKGTILRQLANQHFFCRLGGSRAGKETGKVAPLRRGGSETYDPIRKPGYFFLEITVSRRAASRGDRARWTMEKEKAECKHHFGKLKEQQG